MSTTKPSHSRRFAVMTVDQVVSGGSNVLIAILVARLVSVSEFGRFGVVQLLYIILIGFTRALVSDLLLVNPQDAKKRSGDALGAVLVVAGVLTVALALAAVALLLCHLKVGQGLLILAACLPLLALQDVGRFLGFSTQRIGRALILDLVWLVLMLAGVAVLIIIGSHNANLLTAVWLSSGALSGLITFVWYRVRSVRLRSSLLRDNWQLGWRYLVMYGSMQITALLMVTEVGAVAGAVALGAVQASIVLVRPFTTVMVAVMTIFTGDVARSLGHRQRIVRQALTGSALMVGVAAVNGVVLLVLPAVIGRQLLGSSWHYAKPLLLPTGLEIIGMGLVAGPGAALNGMKAMRQVMRVVWTTPPILLVCAGVGAELNGAVGCLWMVAVGQMWIGVLYWVTFAVAVSSGGAEGLLQVDTARLRTSAGPLVGSRQLR